MTVRAPAKNKKPSVRKSGQSIWLKNAEKICAEKGVALTDVRALVLGIIAGAARPVGAYDILAEMAKAMDNPKPPTAYRAIEFLQAQRLIHRIESLNAYIACHADHQHDGSQFMICDGCGQVEEVHVCHLPRVLADRAATSGFETQRWNVELHGLCRACATGALTAAGCK